MLLFTKYNKNSKIIVITEEQRRQILTENSSYELNEIGAIDYSCDFDEEEYNEWLEDEGMEKSNVSLVQYFKDCVSFELELFDADDFHHMDWQSMYYSEIEDEYGKKIANEILTDCMKKGKGSLETLIFIGDDIDINNPEELNAEAMKLLKNGRYFKDARGYILSNGVVIYTEAEHNMVSRINCIEGTFHFISLGNIRVLPNSIDMARKPTPQQERVLIQVIKAYANDVLYVDYMNTANGNFSKTYNQPNFELIMNDINRLYGQG